MARSRRFPWIILAAACLLVACSGGGNRAATTTTAPAYPRDGQLRLNQIQALGTHNSYHVEPVPKVMSTLRSFDASFADSIEYSHPPLVTQFGTQGIRQVELDVWSDPAGGHYAHPRLPAILKLDEPVVPAMEHPGFKVFHMQDVDYRSNCPTLANCLQSIRQWSDAHPGHVPIMVLIEAKASPINIGADLGWTPPLPIGPTELDALDAEIRSVFDANRLITPDDVRGNHDTLEEAVTTDGWPTLAEARGKVLFTLDNEDAIRTAYLKGHPSLRGRVLFTSSQPGQPSAAFVKLNDPVKDGQRIRQLVAKGYIVRTRTDADTKEARTGDTKMRDAAIRSGAQWVSTDYPVPDPIFDTGYVVRLPGGEPARCNPVSAPASCRASDIENPDHLG